MTNRLKVKIDEESAKWGATTRWNIIAKPVGAMEIVPGVKVTSPRKPNWFHRLMVRWLLGWKWEDARKS